MVPSHEQRAAFQAYHTWRVSAIRWCAWCFAASKGAASKLSGALQWAASSLFKRLGRAMLRLGSPCPRTAAADGASVTHRPLYEQGHGRTSSVSGTLEESIRWWLRVLEFELHEERLWVEVTRASPWRSHSASCLSAGNTAPSVSIHGRSG